MLTEILEATSKCRNGEESAEVTQEKKAWPSSHLAGIKFVTCSHTTIAYFPTHAEVEMTDLGMHKHGFDLRTILIIGKD